ncbi:hypothetical protein SAMN05660420_00799 [Desulfuromusa kysingii]|uniref:Uncharacterized protein n=1 Tax=Desulfuromusa kysingii TaxID=37625 RepID=A0A1H3X361_9BACT|nr:hypothetical protein SAMN05660420_00799 [Desulfuromusa kysingii]
MFEGFSPSFAAPQSSRGMEGTRDIAGKELGTLFCILICGATKEYGVGRGRNPVTLSVIQSCSSVCSIKRSCD